MRGRLYLSLHLPPPHASSPRTTETQVHSTLAAGLLPANAIASVDDVYAWLASLLQTVWRDPVCGDGVCESPFEFASFGVSQGRRARLTVESIASLL